MRRHEKEGMSTLGAIGIGMLTMYLLDPEQGRRRRAVAMDKLRSTGGRVTHLADVASRDTMNRGRGLAASVRSRLTREHDVTPHKLEERVRSRIGRAISNPRAIRVQAVADGRVSLSGPILADDVNALMSAVWAVRGVTSIEDHLEVHQEPGSISALQGAPRAARRNRWMVKNWPPSLRLLAGTAGVAAAAASLSRGRFVGLLGALAGGALVARSVANQSLSQMAGLSGQSVHIDKEMFIAAPPERVYEFWCHQENFPQFMRNVQDVHPTGTDQWHWKVSGPFRTVEWDSEIVEREENRRLVWRSLPGASVQSEGRVDFQPDGDGTRLRVSMSYTPTAGAVGHVIARVLGRDAKTQMDEDLMRVKSFLETGTLAHDAAARRAGPTAEEAARLH